MDTFNVQFFANEDLAYQATKKADIWGYVSFHANFSEAFFGRIWNQIDSDKKTRKESTTEVSFLLLVWLLLKSFFQITPSLFKASLCQNLIIFSRYFYWKFKTLERKKNICLFKIFLPWHNTFFTRFFRLDELNVCYKWGAVQSWFSDIKFSDNLWFCDIMRFGDSFCGDQKCH